MKIKTMKVFKIQENHLRKRHQLMKKTKTRVLNQSRKVKIWLEKKDKDVRRRVLSCQLMRQNKILTRSVLVIKII